MLAGEREAQAPSSRTRRAWGCPVCERRRSPVEDSEGGKPREFSSCREVSNRVRSPSAAPVVTAPVPCTPRQAWRASTTGARRPGCSGSVRSCSRRASRAVGSLPARRYAWHTIGWAGVGQTTALRHRRGAGPQGARPAERIACRRRHAVSRTCAALRSRRASARARPRSRRHPRPGAPSPG